MFAIINHLKLNAPVDRLKQTLEEGAAVVAGIDGLEAIHFVHEGADQVAVLVFWADAQAAERGAGAFMSTWFVQHIAPHLNGELQRTMGEVFISVEP